MIDFAIVEALEQHYKTADGYVKQLESKRIKLPRDRRAIQYWEKQSHADALGKNLFRKAF